ncbi:sulfotransferase [Mariniradius sediminis]|uniref:Sulfotransferase n=1 Tax=Mariniradius sediminis TaxID=2909237 RepID=A0ABS9BU90_9BACT|nr:sulfotransferase [Mariniradius sediminis]MCF1750919.1 sulfotransferase [Mariniradius sediminis]
MGFYRSATTYLQQMVSSAPQMHTPNVFESVAPELLLVVQTPLKKVLTIITNTLNIQNRFHRIKFTWDFPGEDDVALNALLLYNDDFNRLFQYPSKGIEILHRYYSNQETISQKNWKAAHLYFTDKIRLRYPGKTLVLKSPPNTGRISHLKMLYPDAKFIFIKREEKECLNSNKRLWDINRSYSFENYSESTSLFMIQQMYKVFHARYEQDKKHLYETDLVELTFEELTTNTKETLGRIFQKLAIN